MTITGITETHLTGNGEEPIVDGITLIWSGRIQRRGTVALVLKSSTRKALLSFKPMSSRLLRARIEGKHGKITVLEITVTNEAEDDDKDDLYALLSSELSTVSPQDYLTVLGDFNACVANSSGLYDAAVGPLTVDAVNDNGEWLLNYCITHALSVTNTWFVRRDIAMHTWYSNDGKTKRCSTTTLHDNAGFRLSRTADHTGAELGNTDHRLVSGRIKLQLRAKKSNSSSSKKINTFRMKQDPWVCERYIIEVSNHFEALQQYSESESASRFQ